MTRRLHELTLPEAVEKVDDWQNNRSGSFLTSLFETMGRADAGNLDRLEKAFPNLVFAFKLWRGDTHLPQKLSQLSFLGETEDGGVEWRGTYCS